MKVNVSQLLKAPIGTVRNYTVSEAVDIAGGSRPVEGEVRMMRTDRSILVKGTLRAEVELICGRCLGLFISLLTVNIEEEYFPTADIISGVSLPLPDEAGSFIIDHYNILDLAEAVRQYALLSMPMKPLCDQDCAGLCPTCGGNLNQVSCNCSLQPADPRWAGLSKLLLTNNQVSGNEQKGRE